MTLLDAHLEQISACALSIAEIPFPPPKIFTNALLQTHDITALIRDTEVHERALFSVPPPQPNPKAHDSSSNANRRATVFNTNGGASNAMGGGANAMRAPRRNTAVAAVLGSELVERIRRGGGGGIGSGLRYRGYDSRNKQDIDVETLLEGAEKLCTVYPIAGAREKIAALRQRHHQLVASIEHYEYKVAEQAEQLQHMNRPRHYDDEEDLDEGVESAQQPAATQEEQPITAEDMLKEEDEVKELERKKRGLEDRVNSMGRDISGVLR